MSDLLLVVIGTVVVNHLVLVGRRLPTATADPPDPFAAEASLALASALTLLVGAGIMLPLDRLVLAPLKMEAVRVLAMIACSAAAGKGLSWIMSSATSAPSKAPHAILAIANGAVLGVAFLQATVDSSPGDALVGLATLAAGFAALVLAGGEAFRRIDHTFVLAAFRGTPLMLIAAGLAALGLLGLAG
jgi:electron transport complex protein RnfA